MHNWQNTGRQKKLFSDENDEHDTDISQSTTLLAMSSLTQSRRKPHMLPLYCIMDEEITHPPSSSSYYHQSYENLAGSREIPRQLKTSL
jgi:hypothetical protein